MAENATRRSSFAHFALPADLKAAPINPSWILEGRPSARATRLTRSHDGFCHTYMWECSPGKFNWFYDTDETLYLIGGLVILDEGLATERRITAGDVVYFPAGSRAKWHVIEQVYKVAFCRRPMPKSVAKITNALRDLKHRRRAGQPAGRLGGSQIAIGN